MPESEAGLQGRSVAEGAVEGGMEQLGDVGPPPEGVLRPVCIPLARLV